MRGIERLRRAARGVTNRFTSRALILLYHRVVDRRPDPQLLCVTPQHFAEHLEILRRHGIPLALKNLHRRTNGRTPGYGRFVVTFDDGYADNLLHAKPLLERYDTPATVFIATGLVGSKGGFWKDDLNRLLLAPGILPERLDLNLHGEILTCELGDAAEYNAEEFARHRGWNVADKIDPTTRHTLYRVLCHRMAQLSDAERGTVLELLLEWAGRKINGGFPDRTLSEDEMIELAQGGLVEIGAHTVTHPVLSSLPADAQRQEIERSKFQLEEKLGNSVTSFAYPYGGTSHYSAETVALVRAAGYKLACSNFAGLVRNDTDPWQLPRFLVRDWPGEKFAAELSVWLRS